MMATARFTPSLLDRETLEKLFVSRQHLLDLAIGKINAAASGSGRSHLLFVGPRGAGKTHLVSLAYHRATSLPEYGEKFQISWLLEDPWTIFSAQEFFDAIVDHLEPKLHDHPRGAEGVIAAARAAGPIVVFVENLDQVLDQIGSDGQRAVRALIENERALLLIATTTRITPDLRSQGQPFYGFFDEVDLPPLDVDGAQEMLQALARESGDDALAAKLAQPSSRAKLAAVEHLTGGQPRVWALLGAGLTVDGLDDLVKTLVERFDDLTPYYQEQLARLSRNERRVVKALSDADRSLTVKMLAELTGIEQRSLSRTMTDLRRRGWVKPRTGYLMQFVDQRLTYYDLAEPLARIAFQLKTARGRPVRLILDFLVAWFDFDALAAAPSIYAAAARALLQTPDAELQRQLTAELFVERKIQVDQFDELCRYEDQAGFAERLWLIDEALSAVQWQSDVTKVLALPAGLSRALEDALSGDDSSVCESAALHRLVLGWLSIGIGQVDCWRPRGEDAEKGLRQSNFWSALPLIVADAAAFEDASVAVRLTNLWESLKASAGQEYPATSAAYQQAMVAVHTSTRDHLVSMLCWALTVVGRADLIGGILAAVKKT